VRSTTSIVRSFAASAAALVLGGCLNLQATCPFNLTPHSARSASGSEHWCETHRGLREGPYERRYSGGHIAERGAYLRDKRAGTWTSYDAAGQRVAERPYVNGAVSGEVLHWHASGRLARQTEYFDGVAQGSETRWYENGAVQSTGRWCAGRECGEWQWFDERGERQTAPRAR
jgi:antitoxin component YwqK of YwqJK toxin-antitoxin module